MLNRKDILSAADLTTETVACPEWATDAEPRGDVLLQSMSASARDEWEQTLYHSKQGDRIQHIRASLVAACAVDEEGNRLFTADDVVALGKKSAAPMDRLFSAAQTLNAIHEDDIEDLEKN